MASRYEALRKERYVIDQTSDGERIRIKACKQISPLLFLPVWLAGWSAGGFMAIGQIIHQFSWFLMFWLCGWLLGWVFAAGTVVWMLAGAETLRPVGADLEIGQQLLGFSRRWLYEGTKIRHLSVASQPTWPFGNNFQMPLFRTRTGTIRFDYGARTYFAGAGLNDAEARFIIDRLAKHLPTEATG